MINRDLNGINLDITFSMAMTERVMLDGRSNEAEN